MKLLKEKVMEVMNNINQNWVTALKEETKEENKNLSYTDMMGKFSEEMKSLNQHFIDYEERKKKKGFFR